MNKNRLSITTLILVCVAGFLFNTVQSALNANRDLTSTQNAAVYIQQHFIQPYAKAGEKDSILAPLRDWLFDLDENKEYPVGASTAWLAMHFTNSGIPTSKCVPSLRNSSSIICDGQVMDDAIQCLETLYKQRKVTARTADIYFKSICARILNEIVKLQGAKSAASENEILTIRDFPMAKINILLNPPFWENIRQTQDLVLFKNLSIAMSSSIEHSHNTLTDLPAQEPKARFMEAANNLEHLGQTTNSQIAKKLVRIVGLLRQQMMVEDTAQIEAPAQ